MRARSRLLKVGLASCTAAALLPFCLVTVLYVRTINHIGELPSHRPKRPLPRLIELGIWDDIGESPTRFEVEATWPWTPLFDIAQGYRQQKAIRPGAWASNRVSGLWLGPRHRGSQGEWHLRRAALNVWLSRHWTASELTQEMARSSFFGCNATGIDQAAHVYFGKTPETLSTGETAYLVGLLRSPSRNRTKGLERRNAVLSHWQMAGLITSDEATSESAKPLELLHRLGEDCESP